MQYNNDHVQQSRIDIEVKMSNVSLICPHCGSYDVLAGKKWCICDNCGERFQNADTSAGKKMKLFVSYSHKEEEICTRIVRELQKRGHQVWFDHDKINAGADWREEIVEGIKSSNGVIAFLSESSVRNPGVCLNELRIAIGVRGGNIKTVLLEPESKVRAPSSISYIQWLDMSEWRDKSTMDEEDFEAWFADKFQELLRVIESPENMGFSGQISSIKEALPLISYDTSKQSSLISQPFVGRKWLTDRIENWLDDPQGSPALILYGEPGIGKSAFAANYCHYNYRVIASLFCEHNRNSFQQAKSVIQTLAYLLACRMPEYRAILSDVLKYNPQIMDLDTSEMFSVLLAHPLIECSVDGGHETVCIVIDGVDECGDYHQNALAQVISRYANRLPRWLRLFLTARKVSSVTGILQDIPHEELCGDTTENIRDVEQYFSMRLSEYMEKNECGEDFIKTLSSHSGGIFLYARIISEAFLEGKMSIEKMDQLPKGISHAFISWFGWFFPDMKEYADRFRLPLGALTFSPEPIPVDEFIRLFGWDENDLGDLQSRFGILIRTGKNTFGKDTAEVSHKYIKDWLGSDAASGYRCDKTAVYRYLGRKIFTAYSEKIESMSEFELLYLFDFLKESNQTDLLDRIMFNPPFFLRLTYVGSQCLDEGKIANANVFFKAAKKIADYCMEKSDAPDIRLMYSIALLHLAEINEAQGSINETKRLYSECYEVRKQLYYERGNENDQKCFGLSCERLAGVYTASGDSARARELFVEGLAVRERLNRERGDAEDKRNLASNLQHLAELEESEGHGEEADRLLEKCLAVRHEQYALRQSIYDLKDLIVATIRRATFEQLLGRYDKADQLIERVIGLTEKVPKDSQLPEIQRAISYCYAYKGESLRQHGKYTEALEWYLRSLKLRKQMVADRGSKEDLWNLGGIYSMIAFYYYETGQLQQASSYAKLVENIDRELIEERNKPSDRSGLSYVLMLRGLIEAAQGNYVKALSVYDEADAISEQVYKQRGNYVDREDYAFTQHRKAQMLSQLGRMDEAEVLCDNALSLREYQVKTRGRCDDHKFYGASQLFKAGLLAAKGNTSEAESWYLKAMETDRVFFNERHSLSDHDCMCMACILTSEFYLENSRFDEALSYAKQACEFADTVLANRELSRDRLYAERAKNVYEKALRTAL